MTKNEKFPNPSWRTDGILKIVFRLYLRAILSHQCEIWSEEAVSLSHADVCHVTKMANF